MTTAIRTLNDRYRARRAPAALGAMLGAMLCCSHAEASMMLLSVHDEEAQTRISDDHGGRIGTYIDRYKTWHSADKSVAIDGYCGSACTLVLGFVSHDKICVTKRAMLVFHAAYDLGPSGEKLSNREATNLLYSNYPPEVQRWIDHRGGLTRHPLLLTGRDLRGMYRPCASSHP